MGIYVRIYLDLYNILTYTYLTENQSKKIETSCFASFSNLNCFVFTQNAGNEEPGLAPVDINSPNVAPASAASPQGPFSGQGYRLGGDIPPQSNNFARFGISDEP